MKRLLALFVAALLLLSMPLSAARAEGDEPPAEPPAQGAEATEPSAPESTEPPASEEPPADEGETPAADQEPSQEPAAPEEGVSGEDPQGEDDPEPADQTDPDGEGAEAQDADGEGAEPAEEPTHDEPQWLKSLACWEREYRDMVLTGDLREDILIIARSQLGYSADWTCYEEDETGRHLYTRYGAWDGATFSDWCDSFVSFCIFYAGNASYPGESSCYRHMFALKKAGYWREWNSYIPRKGDIVFFSFPAQYPMPAHVGIVEEVIWGEGNQPSRLVTIEGNQNNPNGGTSCVRRMVRLLSDVVGYGTYEPGKIYPEGYSYRTDGWQTIDPDSPYFLEYPVEEVLRFLGLENTQYYAHWFPDEPEEEAPEEPAPIPPAPREELLPKPQRPEEGRLCSDTANWE